MKKTFLLSFFAVPLISIAQSKLSYDLNFSVSGVSNSSSKATSRNSSSFIFDSSGSPILITPGSGNVYTVAVPQANAVKYKSKLSGGFTVGAKLNYNVYKKFGIAAGASFSYFKATRSVINNTGSFFSPGNFTGIGINGNNGNWDSLRLIPGGTYSYSNGLKSEDKFQFVTFNIPVTVSYSIAKWQLEAGVATSFILNSKSTQTSEKNLDPEFAGEPPPLNPGDPQPSSENETKRYFSLSLSPQYQLTNRLKIGIEYIHALTNAYSTNWYSQDVYPNMKTSSLGLKILYKLK